LKPKWEPKSGDRIGSRPARGAWIETEVVPNALTEAGVAPRAGRVD